MHGRLARTKAVHGPAKHLSTWRGWCGAEPAHAASRRGRPNDYARRCAAACCCCLGTDARASVARVRDRSVEQRRRRYGKRGAGKRTLSRCGDCCFFVSRAVRWPSTERGDHGGLIGGCSAGRYCWGCVGPQRRGKKRTDDASFVRSRADTLFVN